VLASQEFTVNFNFSFAETAILGCYDDVPFETAQFRFQQ
jgi:hypothetical protein